MKDMNSNLEPAHKKLKELKEALDVIQSIEDKVTWAQDFTSYPVITYALDPINEGVDSARDAIEREIDYLEEQISDYDFKLAMFEEENKIDV